MLPLLDVSHSVNATGKYILPPGRLSPNYSKRLSLEETKVKNCVLVGKQLKAVISACFFIFFFCCIVEFGTLEAEDTAGCSKLRTENSQAEAQDKVLWIANKQGFSGEWLGMNQRRKWQRIVPTIAPDIHGHLKPWRCERKMFHHCRVKNKQYTKLMPLFMNFIMTWERLWTLQVTMRQIKSFTTIYNFSICCW